MGLNPNYTEENDWEVISGDEASEQDLIMDDYDNNNNEEEEELRRQLLPSNSSSFSTPHELLQPLTQNNMEDATVNNTAVQTTPVDQNANTVVVDDSSNEDNAESTADSILVDTVVVPNHEETLETETSETETSESKNENTTAPRDDNFSHDSKAKEDNTDHNSNNEDASRPPQSSEQPRGPPKFVASLGASVKHLGDAIGKEGQKIGSSIQKEGFKIGSSIQKESLKLGKAIEEETKRIGQVTQRVFQKPKSRSPSPSAHARHSSRSPPRNATRATATTREQESSNSLIANVLTGAAVLAGSILLARGNKGAGAALLATGGATYMANEAARDSSQFGRHRHHNSNLNEELGMHMN